MVIINIILCFIMIINDSFFNDSTVPLGNPT